uniref:Anillin domain-containing protein n=1 Tax=Schistosoma mansoni TaxID=6183 RepID=A0A5K4EN30_SCHMA
MASLFRKGTISKDPKLQQDLERFYKIRAAACRILSIAQNPLQRLDAAKTLLVSHAQLLSCMRLVQREKVEDAKHANKTLSDTLLKEASIFNGTILRKSCFAKPGYAQLCLSDIRIPLIWRNIAPGTNMHLTMQQLFPTSSIVSGLLPAVVNASGDNADYSDSGEQCDGYSLFCTIQVGHLIRDTRLIFDIKPGTADIEFNDKWTFDDVTSEFECIIEIYAFPKGGSKNNSLFSKRRILPIYDGVRRSSDQHVVNSDSSINQNSSQYFDLIGRCVATLKDVQNKVSSHTLEMGNQLVYSRECKNSSLSVSNSTTIHRNSLFNDQSNETSEICDLPLFGNICYRLIAQPHSAKLPLKSGYLWIRKLTPSPIQTPMMLYRCELRDRYLWCTLINTSHNEGSSHEFSSSLRQNNQVSKCDDLGTGSCSNPTGINSENFNQNHEMFIPPKEHSHENDFLKNLTSSFPTVDLSRNNLSAQKQFDHTSVSCSLGSGINRNLLSSYNCHADLIIPIHTETDFLDSQLVLRQTELSVSQRTNESSNISGNDFNKSNECSISSPKDDKPNSDVKCHHADVNYVSLDNKRIFSAIDVSCLSNSSSSNDQSYTTQSFFSANKPGLLNYQSVDNILDLSKTEHFVHFRGKTNILKSLSNNVLSQFEAASITKSNGSSPSVKKFMSTSKSSLSPIRKHFNEPSISPVDSRKRYNRVSRSVEPVRRIFPKVTTVYKMDTSSLFDLTKLRELQYLTQHSSKASSFISVNDSNKDNKIFCHQPCVFSSQLLTFRIATCHLDRNVSSTIHHLSELRKNGSSVEVFEFTATQMMENDLDQLNESSTVFKSDEEETIAWFSIMKKHVQEQEIWGSEAFSENIIIPKSKSNSIRNTSARRSVAIPSDISILT